MTDDTAEQTLTMLKKLCNDFDEHRKEARKAMEKVEQTNTMLTNLAPAVRNLNELPSINENISALRIGLFDQNKTLVTQNGVLIQPNTRTQNMLVNLVFASIFAVFLLVAFILLRESKKDFEVGKNGFRAISPAEYQYQHQEQQHAPAQQHTP